MNPYSQSPPPPGMAQRAGPQQPTAQQQGLQHQQYLQLPYQYNEALAPLPAGYAPAPAPVPSSSPVSQPPQQYYQQPPPQQQYNNHVGIGVPVQTSPVPPAINPNRRMNFSPTPGAKAPPTHQWTPPAASVPQQPSPAQWQPPAAASAPQQSPPAQWQPPAASAPQQSPPVQWQPSAAASPQQHSSQWQPTTTFNPSSWQTPPSSTDWGAGVVSADPAPPAPTAPTPPVHAAPIPRTSATPASVINMFDPFAAPAPVVMPALDAASVTRRCADFHQRGALSTAEYHALSNKVHLLPTKVTLALDRLEVGDRQGVFELMLNNNRDSSMSRSASSWGQPEVWTSAGSNPFDSTSATLAWNAGGAKSSSTSARAGAGDDDSDSDSDSSTDNVLEEDKALAHRLQEQFDQEDNALQVPHPAAGGFKESLPSCFVMVNGEMMGQILIRVTSKKLFRKWKNMFFVLSKDRICLYDRSSDFEAKNPPRIVYRMHSCMYIKKPEAKQTFSVMDESRQIYYTTFRENITEEGGSSGYTGVRSSQNKYSFDSLSERICKFGAERPNKISAFAYALHGVVQWKRREKALILQSQQMHGGSGSAGRYN